MKKTILIIATVGSLLAAICAPCNAQTFPNTFYGLTNVTALIAPTCMTNLTSQPITVRPGYGGGFAVTMLGSNSATGNLVIGVDVTADGTNWTTHAPIQLVLPLGGAAYVRVGSNIPPAILDCWRYYRATWVSNQTAQCLYLTNLVATRKY